MAALLKPLPELAFRKLGYALCQSGFSRAPPMPLPMLLERRKGFEQTPLESLQNRSIMLTVIEILMIVIEEIVIL